MSSFRVEGCSKFPYRDSENSTRSKQMIRTDLCVAIRVFFKGYKLLKMESRMRHDITRNPTTQIKKNDFDAEEIVHRHIKGHQDQDRGELSRESRMNIQTDALAMAVLGEQAIYSEMMPLLCSCYLKHRGQIITSQEWRVIQCAYDKLQFKSASSTLQ
jgi:hypothetical protein